MSNYVKIDKDSNNWPGSDRGFNQRFVLDESNIGAGTNKGVYVVTTAQDVVDALNTANSNHDIIPGDIRVVSGGHCYENFVFENGTTSSKVIVDMSTMSGTRIEMIEGKKYLVVEPGVGNWDAQHTLFSLFGKALPGGSCYSVCAGGHVSGGGYGLLSRLHGLTVDYLSGVDIVVNRTGTFELLKYTPSLMDSVEPNSATPRDLIWASKGGGGGQFGVITAYYFEFDKLPNSPEYAMYEAATIPWKDLDSPELLRDFINTYRTACLELPLQGFTLGKLNWNGVDNKGIEHGNDIVILIQVVYGDSTSHSKANGGVDVVAIDRATAKAAIEKFFSHFENARFLKTTRSGRKGSVANLAGHPVNAVIPQGEIHDLPWIDVTQALNGSGDNQNGKYKSANMKESFTLTEATGLYNFLRTIPESIDPTIVDIDELKQTIVQIDSYGGQINEMDTVGNNSNRLCCLIRLEDMAA